MTLIKKTIILSQQGADGYLTAVRVGSESGAKIVGGTFTSNMTAGVRVGNNPLQFVRLTGIKTEFALDSTLKETDELGCKVMKGHAVVTKGGTFIESQDIIDFSGERVEIAKPKAEADEAIETIESIDIPVPAEVPAAAKEDVEIPLVDYPVKEIERPKAVKKKVTPKKSEADIDASKNTEDDLLSRLGKGGENFYRNAREQIEELFVVYPPETNLEKAIPSSRWVKVAYDGEDYYVVGKLVENAQVTFIGYGVPGVKAVEPPKIAHGYADFLPIENLGSFEGYWLIFQDAETGRISNM